MAVWETEGECRPFVPGLALFTHMVLTLPVSRPALSCTCIRRRLPSGIAGKGTMQSWVTEKAMNKIEQVQSKIKISHITHKKGGSIVYHFMFELRRIGKNEVERSKEKWYAKGRIPVMASPGFSTETERKPLYACTHHTSSLLGHGWLCRH